MQFKEKRVDDIVLLTLVGETFDHETVPNLKECLLGYSRAGNMQVAMNTEHIQSIRTKGLGVLVLAHKTLKESGGELKLFNMNEYGKELFELTKLNKRIDIYDSEESVIQSFKGQICYEC